MISSEEINFLVYRYLQESGFTHSAFTFSNESLIMKSASAQARSVEVPPGALISFIQKGLLYLEVEHKLEEKGELEPLDGAEREAEMQLEPSNWRALARSQSVRYAKWSVKHDKNRDDDDDDDDDDKTDLKRKRIPSVGPTERAGANDDRFSGTTNASRDIKRSSPSTIPSVAVGAVRNRAKTAPAKPRGTGPSQPSDLIASASRARNDQPTSVDEVDKAPADEASNASDSVSQDDVLVLSGHEAEVFCCSWHPQEDILASGSGDSTVRLWTLGSKTGSKLAAQPSPPSKILEYTPLAANRGGARDGAECEDHDVTTLEWSTNGELLATGCMDGIARLWSREGALVHSLAGHSESIFSLRFDSEGKRLLTGSYDKCVSVWDVASGGLVKKFEAHSAQVLDVDWKRGGHEGFDVFASCSTDRTIAVCSLNDSTSSAGGALQVLAGHADEVNAIRWDPSGCLLASCSDDRSVLVWQLGKSSPVHRFCDHTEEIYTIRWSPTGPSTNAPNAPVRLASASFDATVRLWDTTVGACAHTLRKHDKKVYTIAFSPFGDYLASGSLGGQLNIWSVSTGKLIKTFLSPVHGNSGVADIFEVAWNASGNRLAATSTNAVTVLSLPALSHRNES